MIITHFFQVSSAIPRCHPTVVDLIISFYQQSCGTEYNLHSSTFFASLFFFFLSICHRSLVDVFAITSVIIWLNEQRLPTAFRKRSPYGCPTEVSFGESRIHMSDSEGRTPPLHISEGNHSMNYLITEIGKSAKHVFFQFCTASEAMNRAHRFLS